MRKTALFIGEPMIELIPDATGASAKLGVAGDVLNAAIYMRAAAPADWDVSIVSKVGPDVFSDRIVSFAGAHGLQTGRMLRDPSRGPGVYAISVDRAGERSFTYWRSASAARVMFGADGALDFGRLDGADLIFFSAITLAILSPEARRGLLDTVVRLRRSGATVAFDSNYRPRLWEDTATARQCVDAAHRLADVALPSIDDEMAVFGETEDEATRRLARYDAHTCFLKRGARGPLILKPGAAGAETSWPAAETVVDTTGAGDAFAGTALAHLVSGLGAGAAALAAHEMARTVVGISGAILPGLRENAGAALPRLADSHAHE